MMQAAVVKAYMDAWEKAATQFENMHLSGTGEVAFLLRRAAKLAGKAVGMEVGDIPDVPRVEPSSWDVRPDADANLAT